MVISIHTLEAEADSCFNEEDFIQARAKYQQLLKLRPDAQVHNRLGLIAFYRKRYKSAINHILKALESDSKNPLFWVNLGLIYATSGDNNQAHDSYDEALKIKVDCLQALNASGSLYAEAGNWSAATEMFKQALKVEPRNANILNNKGNVLKLQGYFTEALSLYEKALKVSPADANTLYNIGCLHNCTNHPAQAIIYFERSLAINDHNVSASHLLSALKGENTNAAPREYITDLFDEYAHTFEHNLVNTLLYNVPEDTYNEFLTYHKNTPPIFKNVLDLGCGTGLGGMAFQEVSEVLTGIDLSSSMLKIAAQHNIYDQLYEAEITEFLICQETIYDLVLACDVLIYVGDLAETFRTLTERVSKGAFFNFSIELSMSGGEYSLKPSGRYAHTTSYIETLAKKFGWSIELQKETGIRKDKDKWINGEIYILKKI